MQFREVLPNQAFLDVLSGEHFIKRTELFMGSFAQILVLQGGCLRVGSTRPYLFYDSEPVCRVFIPFQDVPAERLRITGR